MHLLFPDSVDQKFPVGHRFKYTCEKPGTHSGPSRINCALVLSNFRSFPDFLVDASICLRISNSRWNLSQSLKYQFPSIYNCPSLAINLSLIIQSGKSPDFEVSSLASLVISTSLILFTMKLTHSSVPGIGVYISAIYHFTTCQRDFYPIMELSILDG